MKKLLAFLIMMCFTIGASATVKIGGKELSSGKSFSSSSGVGITSGKISLSGSTLTLDNVTMQSSTCCIDITSKTSIVVKGKNSLTTLDDLPISIDAITSIGGSSTDTDILEVKCSSTTRKLPAIRIYNAGTLTIADCTVKATGVSGGINGYVPSSSITIKSELIIRNAAVEAQGNGNYASINSLGKLTLDGSEITSPSGAAFNASVNAVCTSATSTTTVKSVIKFAPIKYPVFVKGIQVTYKNKDDVLGDGKVKYSDNASYANLICKDATIDGGSASAIKVTDSMTKSLYLILYGTNTFKSGTDAIYLNPQAEAYICTTTSTVKATITSTNSANNDGIFVGNKTKAFTIYGDLDLTISSKGKYGIRTYAGSTLINSTIRASGASGAFYSSVEPTLKNVFVETPWWGGYNTYCKAYTSYYNLGSSTASPEKEVNILAGEDYGVMVCGFHPLNSTNYSTIGATLKKEGSLTSGSVSYVVDAKVGNYILFDNAVINYNKDYIVNAKDDIQIILKGTSSITHNYNYSAFNSGGAMKVRYFNDNYDAKLNITANQEAFRSASNMDFNKVEVEATTSGEYGIFCWGDFKAYDSKVYMKASKYALYARKSCTLDGSYTIYTDYDKTKFSMIDTETNGIAKAVRIYRGYGIFVNGKSIKVGNLSAGVDNSTTYSPSANKLTIAGNQSLLNGEENSISVYKRNLTIETTGDTQLSTNRYGLYAIDAGTVTLTGKGSLSFTSLKNYHGIHGENTNFVIKDTKLSVKSVGGCGIHIPGGSLTIDHSAVTAKAKDDCIYASKGITIKDAEITEPSGGRVVSIYVADSKGNLLQNTTCKITPSDYDIMVAGVQVTSKNASKITGTNISGTVSYDRASKTLTLNGATIKSAETWGGILAAEDLTINLVGTNNINNSLSSGFCISAQNLTVTSTKNGTLNCKSASSASGNVYIDKNCKLNIQDCNVNITGSKIGIQRLLSTPNPVVNIKNATVKIEGTESATKDLGGINLTNCYYATPSNAVYSSSVNGGSITSGGTACKSVQINAGSATKYGFSVAGIDVTSANASDILSDGGKVKYDNSTKTLTLNKATISYDKNAIAVSNFGTLFKIALIGTNKITSSTGNAIYMSNTALNITSSSSGTLEAISNATDATNGYSPIFLYGSSDLTISNCKITTNNKYYSIRSKGSASSVTISNATITSNFSSPSINYGALDGFKNVTLKGTTITSMSSGIHTKDISLNIVADGTNTITSTKAHGIFVESSSTTATTISSTNSGSLSISANSSGHCGIMYDKSLTIKDVKASFESYTSGIYGRSQKGTLTINNAEVYAKSIETSDAISGITDFTIKDCYIATPKGAKYDASLKGIALNGALCKEVTIKSDTDPTTIAPTVSKKTITVSGVTSSSISLSWTAASDNTTAASKLVYKITYTKSGASSGKTVSVTGKTATEITGLEENTEYKIAMKVYDEDNNSASYTSTTATTAVAPDETKPTLPSSKTITVKGTTPSSISISWKAASDNVTEASKLVYKITYTKSGESTGKTISVTGKTEAEITGLESNTSYKIVLKVYDESGNYASYTSKTVTTDAAADKTKPTLPKDSSITLKKKGKTYLTVSWKAATDDITAAADLQYEISILKDGEWVVVATVKDVTEYKITGLTSGVEYTISIAVIDEAGNRATYKTLTVSTTVGIEEVLADDPDAKMYNTSGLPVRDGYKGVVIINGKKYLKK